jgi:hypothetical protein
MQSWFPIKVFERVQKESSSVAGENVHAFPLCRCPFRLDSSDRVAWGGVGGYLRAQLSETVSPAVQ